jgi:hypothetical protein
MDIVVGVGHVGDADGRSSSIFRDYLHDSNCSSMAPKVLVQHGLLVALRRQHQVVEVIFGCVLPEEFDVRLKLPYFCVGRRVFYPLRVLQIPPEKGVAERSAQPVVFDELIQELSQFRTVLAGDPGELSLVRQDEVRMNNRRNLPCQPLTDY